ncbi:carnosine N-methyltransferase-like [Planococcus citri]|uniref:carnosine N-methyltransferase-like n=1 Tax=Planococcus citri TaxID=170843 RepID=UPI0031F7BCBC
MSNVENDEEKLNFYRIVSAFNSYKSHSLNRISRTEKYVNTLPANHQELLQSYKEHLDNVRSCIERNYTVIKLILKDVETMFENIDPEENNPRTVCIPRVTAVETDQDKVRATLKQFVRDWSTEGSEERKFCYEPIVDEIVNQFPKHLYESHAIKVLVPGAGLGRLVFEIARHGYTCQGNEFSLFMLIASNFVINRCQGINLHQIYPWIHQCDNNLDTKDQLASIFFPDVDLSESIPNSQFSMVAGDFLEVYTTENEWDCVSTCFFIDCANNILAFIEAIYKILKPGGIWINLGPLLYHFSNIVDKNSIEPSYEMIREMIKGFGFIYEKEKTNIKSKYAQNPKSMLQHEYESVYFVCRKPRVDEDDVS